MNDKHGFKTAFPMALALALPALAHAETPKQEWDRYAASRYQYCDAKMLSAHWRQSIEEAKYRIGRKIGWGDTPILNGMLATAREEAIADRSRACTFDETGYRYNDAANLAHLWGVSTLEAKTMIEDKVMRGWDDGIRVLLRKRP